MLQLNKVHHTAIICSDYQNQNLYTEILGLEVLQEIYREERDSYKLDLALNGNYIVELFSFPNPPKRPSRPESCGLRHLAFEVNNVEQTRFFNSTTFLQKTLGWMNILENNFSLLLIQMIYP
jgi:glyoxylase I family protein